MKKSSSDFPSSGWLSSSDSIWQSSVTPSGGRSSHARRLSFTSDSGDTGIGTSCSDSVENHSTSSGTSLFKPVPNLVCLPTAHVMPSTARSSLLRHREEKVDPSHWNSSYSLPGGNRNYVLPDTSLDMKDSRPMKKWASLSKLSVQDAFSEDGRTDKTGSRHSLDRLGGRDSTMSQQSYGHRPSCLHHSMELLKVDDKDMDKKPFVGIDCKYKYDSCSNSSDFLSSAPSSRRHTLDMTYSALPESKPPVSESYGQKYNSLGYQSGVPLQPSVRTQMWLTEQLHANSQDRRTAEELCGLSSWQQLEHLRQDTEHSKAGTGSSRPMYTAVPLSQDISKWESLMKIKEGLLRQKEIVIDRQKQQICQLQNAIRGSELRAHQAMVGHVINGEECYLHSLKDSPCESSKCPQNFPQDRTKTHSHRDREDLECRLVSAEKEVTHLNEVLKQSTSKSSEDIKKLEEKIKTRDKYINSLRKKCQKESEQNREKQRRIETLEKYLADLPTLDDVQKQSERLQVVEEENKQLKETTKSLEKLLNESRLQCREKDTQTECQKQRENELVLTVQSLQHKVQKCLEDGVRLPMLDTKQLQGENDLLREQAERANKVIDNQQKQIDNMTAEIQALKEQLFQEHSSTQLEKKLSTRGEFTQWEEVFRENQKLKEENAHMRRQVDEIQHFQLPVCEKMPVADQLFREMSHCLFDLKALCSILTQRVQGKEPNLSLLLGIGSLNSSTEEEEVCQNAENLTKSLSEVHQLRKDIDDLRTTLSDCYAQDMGDNCITQ
ncbi:centrosomal protein of 85 kDa-like isoform X2 [Bombina bombina]|uniref:centrosomal protein of 85 kDa-like isoform X2 n=1 Tax=Bombina bombina TaxID=8345 RepID=UPI00235A529B|nr:centrosomal protein of 85 kDa-like isoform X2 [Bombina bombina]